MRSIYCSIVLASLVACGGGEGATDDLCAAICERDKECDGVTTCGACPLDQDRLQPAARAAMTDCFDALACGANDDGCFVDGVDAVTPRDIDDNFAELCVATVDSCNIDDDVCGISPLFEQVHVEAAIQCFDGGCGAVEACIGNALGF